jgi:hypothetical protein
LDIELKKPLLRPTLEFLKALLMKRNMRRL